VRAKGRGIDVKLPCQKALALLQCQQFVIGRTINARHQLTDSTRIILSWYWRGLEVQIDAGEKFTGVPGKIKGCLDATIGGDRCAGQLFHGVRDGCARRDFNGLREIEARDVNIDLDE